MHKIVPEAAILVPDTARLVHKGQIFEFYEWDQELFDGSVAVFEMLKRSDTLQVMAVHDGKVIVLEDEQPGQEGPHITLPGGRSEPTDSSWLEGAKRELLEETGMRFKQWRLISVQQPTPKIEWFTPLYLATELESEAEQQLDAGERITVTSMSFADLRKLAQSAREPRLSYLAGVIGRFESLDEVLHAPEFNGKEINR